ncbi:FG-GAP repeat domain-containing protein [Calditrichota bacterium LG25]
MNKRVPFVLFILFLSIAMLFAQTDGDNTTMGRAYSNPAINNITGFGRGIHAGSDLDKDGKPEIIMTQYANGGAIEIFEVVGDNMLEEIWRSPDLGSPYSTPVRTVAVGDLDGDGYDELYTYVSTGWNTVDSTGGIVVFQNNGNDNEFEMVAKLDWSTNPAIIDTGSWRCEDIAVADFDDDGQLELAFTRWVGGDYDSRTVNILSVDGNFASGFYSWNQEYKQTRYQLNTGGSVTGVYYGNLDNDEHSELWVSVYDKLSLRCIESTGPNSYVDSAHVVQIDQLDEDADSYIIKGFVHGDIDGDGTNEIIVESTFTGKLFLLKAVGDVQDSVSVTYLPFLKPGAFTTLALGDQDHGSGSDGMDLYSGGTSNGIWDFEFVGGSLTDSASWQVYNFGRDTAVVDTVMEMVIDTTVTPWDTTYVPTPTPVLSPSWMVFVPENDLDGDGNKELVASYLVAGSTVPMDSTENGTPIPEESKRWLQVFEFGANVPTGIENNWKVITAEDYVLKQNYPNPFNPTTTIEFYLPIKKQISLTIYNALGQKVKTLINNEVLSAGNHALQWDGTNDAGAKVASGMYIYELKYGNFKQQKRMMLMK